MLGYKQVNDVDSEDKDSREWLEEVQNGDDSKFQTIMNNWRAEYDHPCVVSKSRRKVAVTMNDVFQEVNDWEQFAGDSRIQGLLNEEDYPKNSAMYKINSALSNLSPDQQQKVRKANLALALASHNQSFAAMADMIAYQRNSHNNHGSGLVEGDDSNGIKKRNSYVQKQGLLDDFVGRSSSRAVEARGSSLFIRRVADLEEDGNDR